MIDVHVNGRPLQPPATPLVERSRVLLPLRTVFTALGAAVRYDPRTGHIDVHRGLHFLRVTAGSRQAYVDNAPVTLDVPPLEHDGITYLPLRFVAESLGGHVRYLPQRNLIAIEDSQAPGSSPTRVLRHAAAFPPASAAAGGPPTVDYRHPAPGEFVTSAFPSISALIRTHAGTAATVSSLRFYLDGQDLTGALTVAPGAIAYTPANALAPGSHQGALRGFDTSAHVFSSVWTFVVTQPPAGAPPGVVGYQTPAFSARGTQVTAPGGTLQFGLATTVPGGGYVTLCGYSRQYPLVAGNDAYHYLATVAPPIGFFAPLCRVDAYFVDSNGLTSVFTLNTPVSIDTRPKP